MNIVLSICRFWAMLIILINVAAFPAVGDVVYDFEAAKKRAKLEKKDVILSFSGFRWWQETLGINTQTDDPWINTYFIVIEVGIPLQQLVKATPSNEDDQAIRKIRRQFHQLVDEPSPAILVLDESGRPYAEIDSNEQPAEAYILALKEALLLKSKRDHAFQRAEKVSGLEKSRLLNEGLKALCEIKVDGVFHMSVLQENVVDFYYQDVVEQIVKNDPQNTLRLHKTWMERIMIVRQLTAHQAIKQQLDDLAAELNQMLLGSNPYSTCSAAIDEFIASHPDLSVEATACVIMGKVEVALVLRDYPLALTLVDELLATPRAMYGSDFLKSSLKPEVEKAIKRAKEGIDSSAAAYSISLSSSSWDQLLDAEGRETREKLGKIDKADEAYYLVEDRMNHILTKIQLLLRLHDFKQALTQLDAFIKTGGGSKQAQLRDRELRPYILLGLDRKAENQGK